MKRRSKIIIAVALSVAMLSCIALTTFADYFDTSSVDYFDTSSTIGIDTIYSRGFMGDSTYGWFSLDNTPLPTGNGFISDKISLMRGIHDGTQRSFEINNTIRRFANTNTFLGQSHTLGNGNLDGNQLTKLDFHLQNTLYIDTDENYEGMPIMNLQFPLEDWSKAEGLTPTISFKYRNKNNTLLTYSSNLTWGDNAVQGNQVYLPVSVLPSNVMLWVKDNVKSYHIDSNVLVALYDVTYSFTWDRNFDVLPHITPHCYSYILRDTLNNVAVDSGEVHIISAQYYDLAVATDSYNQGLHSDLDTSWLDWVTEGVNSFLDAPFFGVYSLGDVLLVFISIAVLLAFLKLFAGG